jgi:hypothetical protein
LLEGAEVQSVRVGAPDDELAVQQRARVQLLGGGFGDVDERVGEVDATARADARAVVIYADQGAVAIPLRFVEAPTRERVPRWPGLDRFGQGDGPRRG